MPRRPRSSSATCWRPRPTASRSSSGRGRAIGARILVVEDNGDNLALMRFILEALGHEPVLTTSGPEGIEAARRERPDLILMDLQMPGMDGFETTRTIRGDDSLEGVPIVAVTAYAMPGDRAAALRSGFDGYIRKPVSPTALPRQIDEFLAPDKRSAVPIQNGQGA